nr:hypothetical protein [uncultured Helicobacter sp.]
MMNNDFNTDYAIKNFVWFLVFVAVCVFAISKFLLPQIDTYKKQAIETKKSKIAFNQINKDYQAIQSQLKTLVVQNYNILSAIHNKGDEIKLQELLQGHFNAVEVKAISNTKELEIFDTRYQVKGYAPSVQSIEEFILWANTMPYFAKIELPLKMEFDEKSKQIYFVMMISLKNSAYKEHQIILDNNLRFDSFKP